MSNLTEYFESGLNHPYLTTPDDEALCEACEAVTVFLNPSSPAYARMTALTNAGSLVGGMSRGRNRDMITRILRKCSKLSDYEVVNLTAKERSFVYQYLE